MHLTELLITGYDGNEAVFAVTLTPHHADLVLTATNDNETVVDSTRRQATDIFDEIQQLLERLVGAAAVV